MKIALIGYGKMGRTIEALAAARGHAIGLRIGSGNLHELTPENLRRCDVAIEFTRPEAAFANVSLCLQAGVPVVCGTTGWQDQMPKAIELCRQLKGAFLYASNFSVGVNVVFAVNARLAELLCRFPEYRAAIEETHHTEKRDAPSGTAITLAEGILKHCSKYHSWALNPQGEEHAIPITAHRLPNVPGTHVVRWSSPQDSIVLEHTAHSREGFAAGALVAAEWIIGKTGYFTMRDVLGV